MKPIKPLFGILLLLALPVAVQAQLAYITNNGAITITGYSGPPWTVIIPETIDGLPVTSIGNSAFASHFSLTNISIPNSVTNIGDSAFARCQQLPTMLLPSGLTSIGVQAFYSCDGLTSITIPNGATSIGSEAFRSCTHLTNVTIGNAVTSIGRYAFSFCGRLSTIVILGSVNNMGDNAFADCVSLTSVTIANGVVNIGNLAFNYCTKLTSVEIPNTVTNIGYEAFAYCYELTGAYFRGDAPTANGAFDYDYGPIVYYLPGTSGWAPTFCGVPTAPWVLSNPLILTGSSFGLQSNGFGFIVSWASNATVVVEATTELAPPSWTPLLTNTLTNGSVYFSDPDWTNYSSRFYRIRSL